MQSPNFRLDVEDNGTVLVLRLHGELDLASVPTVEATVDRHCDGRRSLVVDLRELDFMDSSGLRMMLELRGRRDGTDVAFVSPGERVGRVLDITGARSRMTWVTEPREGLVAGDS